MHICPEDQANVKWKKLLMKNPGNPFICAITPSGIAYVLAIIKNGKDVWEQAKNPRTSPEKKARRLFSAGEGRKREQYIGVEQGRAGVILHGGKNWRRCTISKCNFLH